ncbi:glucosidase 2 subunit beta-like isoform X2 [Liolophura sinensis]|uniref:glucosidase 2 subunit beta-like isoform X2 n=1 Tax=Liolophura sinensis TaxID=3198878 RepID=UPI0031597637
MEILDITSLFLLLVPCLCQILPALANIPRPRGVAISKAGAYDPTKDFTCFDHSKVVPFEYVNDDYCDCPDGSDEPGTSACPNGWFHCTNAGHIPLNIVSSRVNDGICDCCDGSDEYEGIITCSNTCKELGKQAREEAEKMKILVDQAMKVKVDYIEQGKKAKEEKKARLVQLEGDRDKMDAKRNDLEARKNEAEAPEKEAKDRHQAAWEAEKAKRQSEKEQSKAEAAFNEMDLNKDNVVDLLEVVAHTEFDIDGNGVVSDDEAKEYMEEQDQVDLTTFVEKMWPSIKDIYRPLSEAKPPGTESPEDQEVAPPAGDIPPPEDIKEEARGDDGKKEEAEEEKMPDYNEETKLLIQVADEARNNFNEADEELKKLDKEISDIKGFLELDLGPNAEFYFLREKCYEMTDREYVYKLCPFDKATQRQKSGGAETTLGNWGHWSGPADNVYSSMKYDRGQHCWNGPDRSVEVILRCGLENMLTGASEPNRCEYQFIFTTPAVCSQSTMSDDATHAPHVEL